MLRFIFNSLYKHMQVVSVMAGLALSQDFHSVQSYLPKYSYIRHLAIVSANQIVCGAAFEDLKENSAFKMPQISCWL